MVLRESSRKSGQLIQMLLTSPDSGNQTKRGFLNSVVGHATIRHHFYEILSQFFPIHFTINTIILRNSVICFRQQDVRFNELCFMQLQKTFDGNIERTLLYFAGLQLLKHGFGALVVPISLAFTARSRAPFIAFFRISLSLTVAA